MKNHYITTFYKLTVVIIMITISLKSITRKNPTVREHPVELSLQPDEHGNISAGKLISTLVLHEVDAFRQRQEKSLILGTLTAEKIEEGRDEGKIVSLAQEDTPAQPPVNENRAIKTALQAFEDGLYYMLVNNINIRDLNETIPINQDIHIMFVKLTALEGG
jgi:hypothetical protein